MNGNIGTHTEQWTQLLSSLRGCLDSSRKCINPAVFSQGLERYLRENSGGDVPGILRELSEALQVSNSSETGADLSDVRESVLGILQGDIKLSSISDRIDKATTLQECFSEEVVRVAEELKKNVGMLVNVYTKNGYKTCTQGRVPNQDMLQKIKQVRNRLSMPIAKHLLRNNMNVRVMKDSEDNPIIPNCSTIFLEFIGKDGQLLCDDLGREIIDLRGITFIFPKNYHPEIRERMLSDPQFALEILLYLEPEFLYTHTHPERGFFPSGELTTLSTDLNSPVDGKKSAIHVPNKELAERLYVLGGKKESYLSRRELY